MVRSSALKLLLLASFSAEAQVVGWIDCRHTAPGEKFGYIKVALMDVNTERKSSIKQFSLLKPGANTIQFTSITGPAQFTGMRLGCEIIVPEELQNGVASEEPQYTVNWRTPLIIPDGMKIAPALGLTLIEFSPGQWRAFIGNAP